MNFVQVRRFSLMRAWLMICLSNSNPIWYFFHLSPRQNIFLNDKAEFVLNSHELFFDFLIRKQRKIGKFKLVWTGNSIIRGYRYFVYICIKLVQINFLRECILFAANANFRRRCTCGYLVKWSIIWFYFMKISCCAEWYMLNFIYE